MPYIDKQDREEIDFRVSDRNPETGQLRDREVVSFHVPETPGELNYVLSKIVRHYIDDWWEPNYSLYNEIVGVLECCKLELWSSRIGPYERQKLYENGDLDG